MNFIWSTKDEKMAYNILTNANIFNELNNNEENIVKAFYHYTSPKLGENSDNNKN